MNQNTISPRTASWREELRKSRTAKERTAIERVKMPELTAEYRVTTLTEEVNSGLTRQQAVMEASRCLDCPDPQCVTGCPVEINIPGFVKNIAAKAEALADGETVTLVREPDNKYDKMAIRIDNAAGEKLGYIPRQQNEIPARLLDGGKMLFAKVAGKEISEFSSWVNIFIRIYMKDL